ADDAALDVVAGDGDGGRRALERVFPGVALDDGGEEAAGLLFGAELGFLEDVPAEVGGVAEGLLADLLQDDLAGFCRVESGDAGKLGLKLAAEAGLLGDLTFEGGAELLDFVGPAPHAL